jgi:Icc-related predicted phosphoesterase
MEHPPGLPWVADALPSCRPVWIAATGDLHIRGDETLDAFPGLGQLRGRADVLLIAGDITDNGRLLEAEAAARLLAVAGPPVVAVLGNHDLRSLRRTEFRRIFERAGIEILAGNGTVVRLPDGRRLGIAGATGGGGGFWPIAGPDAIHTRTLKRLALRADRENQLLERALAGLEADVLIATTHFAPTVTTLGSEPLAKYWMLGNCDLGAVLDRSEPDLVVHGHAHRGTLRGKTPGGIPVRNVALPVVGRVYMESIASTRLRSVWEAPARGARS